MVSTIFRTWWPLSLSWLLMAFELPAITLTLSLLPDAEANLAAFGSIAFPLAMLIEAPIVMMLTAGAELVRDAVTLRDVRRYMMQLGFALTVLHLMFTVTPLFTFVMRSCIAAPVLLDDSTRLALLALTPWTWAIAYRRFYQGVLIRLGRTRVIGVGTAIRLIAGAIVLLSGLFGPVIFGLAYPNGALLGGLAASAGVVAEAVFIGYHARRHTVALLSEAGQVSTSINSSAISKGVSIAEFSRFYLPLACTTTLLFVIQPFGSVAMSRMPSALESLSVWPIVSGMLFVFRSFGTSLNEVVITFYEPGPMENELRKFALLIATFSSAALLLVVATPISSLVFTHLFHLRPELQELGRQALLLAAATTALGSFISFNQGLIITARRTGLITQSVVLHLLVVTAMLFAVVKYTTIPGILAVVPAFTLGMLGQFLFLDFFASRVSRK